MSSVKLLVGWFCPWAQRGWIVANLIQEGGIEVINDKRSILLDTDTDGPATSCGGISQYMMKGCLAGQLGVPTVIQGDGIVINGDSLNICKWLWENLQQGDIPFDTVCSTIAIDHNVDALQEANYWSDLITKPFYNALMNRAGGGTEKHFDELLRNLTSFGLAIKGPFFHGETMGLVDIAILPFAYRIFVCRLFDVYHKDKISQGTLEKCSMDVTRDHQQLLQNEVGLHNALSWCRHCCVLPCFLNTLPHDAVPAQFGFSQRLCDMYLIYAMGVGLTSVNFGESKPT